jgi:hypothetical protein
MKEDTFIKIRREKKPQPTPEKHSLNSFNFEVKHVRMN